MPPLEFKASPEPTIGVEIELGVIDAETCELAPKANEILARVPSDWDDFVKPEFMQSYLEFNTGICETVADAGKDLSERLKWGYEVAEELSCTYLWSGTHPTSRWDEQVITDDERYHWLLDTMQLVAKRLLCFGFHVHVGVDSPDKAIQMCDRLMRHLPVLLAMSSNSPWWNGHDTGLASYRSKIMESLPTAGLPETMRNWSEFTWLIEHLRSTNFIRSSKEIWWDVRPVGRFGTVEVRVMDTPLRMRDLLGLTAVVQCLVVGISDDIDKGAYQVDCHPMIARQNKWHAVRWGLDATLVDPDTMLAAPARQLARRMIDLCKPLAARLGCERELGFAEAILEEGTGTDRQLAFAEDGRQNIAPGILGITGKPWEDC